MNVRKCMQVAAVASALGVAGSAFAVDSAPMGTDQNANAPMGTDQNANAPMGTDQNANAPMRTDQDGSMGMNRDTTTAPLGKTPGSVGGNDQSQRLPSMDTWMNDYATAHDGRITRQEFMDQMAERWDRYDTQRQGYLTPEEARSIYTPTPPRSGADVSPGYMGPGSARGK